VAEAIEELADKLESACESGSLEEAVPAVVKDVYAAHKRIVFGGDNYADEWHSEAESRGLANLRSTPDALPWIVEKQTVDLFSKYDVLSERELESRYEVLTEQYVVGVNIEAETAASIARTLLLPAAVRHLAMLSEVRSQQLVAECQGLVDEFAEAIRELESANTDHPEGEAIEHAAYMRDTVIPAMDRVREVADRLERIVADDLWPLPKYSEMLFIK
jgi:glutamine synthetase